MSLIFELILWLVVGVTTLCGSEISKLSYSLLLIYTIVNILIMINKDRG